MSSQFFQQSTLSSIPPANQRMSCESNRFTPATAGFRSILLAACCLLLSLALAVRASAQAQEPMVYAVGLVSESSGQPWAYLHWRSTALDLFSPRVWSVWRKDGLPADPGEYVLDAVIQQQRHPAALTALFERSQQVLGEDLARTRESLSNLFEDILPDAMLTNGQLASAILQGVEGVPELINTLQIAMRTFPSMAMAMGTAHATPIRSSGPVTFEIRERESPHSADSAVVGRVTVNAAAPLVLPAPGPVALVPLDPDRQATSDLSVSLRWASPAQLRRLSLAQHGFAVWRVPRALAESFDWHMSPPEIAMLELLANEPNSGVGRVNRQPILVNQALSEAELTDLTTNAAPSPSFITDHESRFPGYPFTHYVPKNGDSFYYFVTAMDLLGREGNPSAGILGTFCSRMPPRVPRLVSVKNRFNDDGSISQHHLEITWEANPPEEDKNTSAYAVYRWTSTGQMVDLGRNPSNNLIAIVPHPASGATVSYIDNGLGSPSAPTDYTKTFWYTVRAIDNVDEAGECAIAPFDGNISGNSPPLFGVLRDRISPGPVTGEIGIQCATPVVEITRLPDQSLGPEGNFSPDNAYIDIVFERPNIDANLHSVVLRWEVLGSSVNAELGPFPFPSGALSFTQRIVIPRSLSSFGQIRIEAEAFSTGGTSHLSAPYVMNFPAASKDEPPVYYAAVSVMVLMVYETGFVDITGSRSPCRAHVPSPPSADPASASDPIKLIFKLPTGTRQYKIFYQIDNGPLTLLRERSGTFPANTDIEELWESLPVFARRACFFVQAYDRHGNSGPMSPIGCTGIALKFGVPAPMLKPVEPAGEAGSAQAVIRWASPRPGIEQFELLIHNFMIPALPRPDGWILDGMEMLDANGEPKVFRRYVSPLVSNGFGQAGLFEVIFSVPDTIQLLVYVRARGIGGATSPLSNLEYFTWTAPEAYVGPNVPWPARGAPEVRAATQFNSGIAAVMGPNGGRMIRIGMAGDQTEYDREKNILTVIGEAENRLYAKAGNPNRRLFPLVLYRMQVSDGDRPIVSPDIVQVSPMMEKIAVIGNPVFNQIRDPFIYVSPPGDITVTPSFLYLRDTQPAVGRGIYRYFLVLFDPQTGEIDEILVTNDI